MSRYFTRSALIRQPSDEDMGSFFGLGTGGDRSCEVFEDDPYRNTGVLDATGETIWATDRGPLGFQLKEPSK